MKKSKPTFMRPKTKQELAKLADIMVSKYDISKIKGTNEFLEVAVHEADTNDLDVNWQTVKLQGEWLEKKCTVLDKESKSFTKEEVWPEMTPIKNKFVVMVTLHYNDGTTQEMHSMPQLDFQPEYEEPAQRIPEYSMFVEGEDGLIILKGTNKGKLVHQLDEINWRGYSRSWATYMLKEDKNLTDDDREIFNKMILGQV